GVPQRLAGGGGLQQGQPRALRLDEPGRLAQHVGPAGGAERGPAAEPLGGQAEGGPRALGSRVPPRGDQLVTGGVPQFDRLSPAGDDLLAGADADPVGQLGGHGLLAVHLSSSFRWAWLVRFSGSRQSVAVVKTEGATLQSADGPSLSSACRQAPATAVMTAGAAPRSRAVATPSSTSRVIRPTAKPPRVSPLRMEPANTPSLTALRPDPVFSAARD